MRELEMNTAEKKLFDPVKAKAQIDVYKEIYRLEQQEGLSEEEKMEALKKDGALKILQTASQEDREQINKFFEKKGIEQESEIDQQIKKLQSEIESLEDVHSQH